MNKVLKFAFLDFRLLKPYLKSLLTVPLIGIVMGIVSKSAMSMSVYFLTGLLLVISYPFTISEKNGLDMLYSTLPLDRKTVVRGRYLFVLILGISGIPASLLFSALLSGASGEKFILGETAAMLLLMAGLLSAAAALQYPIYFKYGYTKGRFPALIPLLVIFLGFIAAPNIAVLLNYDLDWERVFAAVNIKFLCALAMPAGTAALGLSCMLSGRIYSKKDL